MKEKLNYVKNAIIILYILVIIFITICLLSFNDYRVSEFGNTTLLPVIDDDLESNYSVGDLLILKKKISDISIGDTIFFYQTEFGEAVVKFAKVTNVERVTDTQSTITVEGDYMLSSDYYIGKTSTTTIIPFIGRIMSLLESKYGFLFLGVLPSLIIFLYTAYTLFLEVRTDDESEEKSDNAKGKNKKIQGKDEKQSDNKVSEDNIEKKITDNKVEDIKSKNEVEENKTEEPKIENKVKEDEIEETKIEEPKVENEVKENKIENSENIEIKEQEKNTIVEEKTKTMTEEQKKALIEAKLKTMTEEQKKALVEAKLKSMTEEEKKALIEAKRKKMQENK